MIGRNYAKGNGRPRLRVNPDAELDAYLAMREGRPSPVTAASIRGMGVVTPPVRVKYRRPRHVRKNQGYYTGGKSGQSTFYAFEPAPYLEFAKDVGKGHSVRKAHDGRSAAPTQGQARQSRDIELMGKMGTIHTQDAN